MAAELAMLRGQQQHRVGTPYTPHTSHTGITLCAQSGDAALHCELRKEKAASRRYQVATENLLKFVEVLLLYSLLTHTVTAHTHRTVTRH